MEPVKGRRSSILKPQKPRNPLSDLGEPAENNLPVVELAGRTSSRRVSFASSNFVKEFATDLEKNTILWDTTYEEMLSKSDSTPSENTQSTHDTQSVINADCMAPHSRSTAVSLATYTETTQSVGLIQHYVCDGNSKKKVSINFNERGGEDIESDSSLCDDDQSKGRILETGNVKLLSSMDNVNVIKHSVAQVSVICKEQVYVNSIDFDAKSVDRIRSLPQTLLQSSTQVNKENIQQTGSYKILSNYSHRKLCLPDDQCNEPLSRTQFMTSKDGIISKTSDVSNHSDCSVKIRPAFSTEGHNQQFPTLNASVRNNNMEFAQHLPPFVASSCNAGNDDMKFSQPSDCAKIVSTNKSRRSAADMELTENFPIFDKNKTVTKDESMQLTQQLPTFNKKNYIGEAQFDKENNSKQYIQQFPLTVSELNTPADKNIKTTQKFPNEQGCNLSTKAFRGEENLEFMQPLSTLYKSNFDVHRSTVSKDSNMEVTQAVPICIKNDSNVKNETLVERNKTMEFTQQVPVSYKSNFDLQKNSTLGCAEMEFTQQLSVPCKNNFGLQKNTILGDADMEFTQQVPVSCTSNFGLQKNSTLGSAEMEFTRQLPVLCKHNFGVQKNTIFGDANMEFSQQLPIFNQSGCGLRNKTVFSDDNMDFTQQSPALDKTNFGGENKTIPGDDDLELTEQLSTAIMENIKPVAHSTVLESDMEFTGQLPVINNKSYRTNKNEKELVKQHFAPDLKGSVSSVDKLIIFSDVDSNSNKKINSVVSQNKTLSFTGQVCINNKENVDGSNMSAVTSNDLGSVDKGVAAIEKNDKNKSYLITVNEIKVLPPPVGNVNTENNILEKTLTLTDEQIFTVDCGNDDNQKDLAENDNEQKDLVDCINDKMDVVEQSLFMNDHNQQENCAVQDKRNINVCFPTAVKTETQNNKNQEDGKEEFREISMIKQSYTDIKTPGSSFQMTFVPFSPGIDDTQHLINYNLNHKPPKSDFSQIITGDLNPSFLSTKFMPLSGFSSDAFPVSLETTRNNQTGLDHTAIEDNCNTFSKPIDSSRTQRQLDWDQNCEESKQSKFLSLASHVDSGKTAITMNNRETLKNLKRRSLEKTESAVVCKKIMLTSEYDDINSIKEDEKMEVSGIESKSINISQENLTLSDSLASVDDSSTYISKAVEEVIKSITQTTLTASSIDTSTTKEMTVQQSSTSNKDLHEYATKMFSLKQNVADFTEKMNGFAAAISKNCLVLQELYNLEAKEYARPFKQQSFEKSENSIDSSTECTLIDSANTSTIHEEEPAIVQIGSEVTTEVEKVLTLKEKIQEKEKRCKRYWNLISVEDNKCEFNTLHKTIYLRVDFHKETGIVTKTEVSYNISDESEPEALFVHKIFKNCLSQEIIRSAVGEPYDVLTLLDYVHINMQKCLDFLKEFNSFANRYALEMDRNMRVTFTLVSLTLLSSWCISVDLSDVENITEDSVTAYARVGTVKEAEIKNFVTGCPRGILFLKTFVRNIIDYFELLEKRRSHIK